MTASFRLEHRVEQPSGRYVADLNFVGDPDLASQHRVRSCPRRRWRRYGARERLATTPREGSCERLMETLGVDFGRLADQHEVDEILDPGALPLVLPEGAGVGVELLGNVLLERDDWQLQRCDVGELQRVRAEKRLRLNWRRFAECDIDWELLEPAAIEVGSNRVADGAKASSSVKCRRAANLEVEEVAEVDAGGSIQMLGCRFLVVARPRSMSFVVRVRSPSRSSSANAPLSIQPLDAEVASLARNRSKATRLRRRISAMPVAWAPFFRRCSSAVAERLCRFVSHGYPSCSAARRMRSATRPPRRSARGRR
jgi:hypothetical protein